MRRVAIVGLALAVIALVVLLLPGMRVAAGGTGTLEACVNPGNGMMRLVDASVACHANETRVEWNIAGPAGPPGPAGPEGPPGPAGSSAGGPPFVWICTPANFPLSAGSPRADLYVFNGSSSTANIAVHMLDKDGNNLVGVTIPGSAPPSTYPGQTGSTTVPLSAGSTQNLNWVLPQTGGTGFDGVTNVSFTITVTSDQPIAVGTDFQFSGFHATACSLLPK
ncbi:MAG TPA: hypothetical protein VE825_15680 [Terriglobales bacterium]|nr:hypothetical protein [Terriglobales bacterium]